MEMIRDGYCSFCGHPWGDVTGWPRRCGHCQQVTFRNPLPVAVALQPITTAKGVGLLTIRRAIDPAQGALALPGGYVDNSENWRDALVRELFEETQVTREVGHADIEIVDTLSNPQGDRILIFGRLPAIADTDLPAFTPTHESSERRVITAAQEMAFSLHTEVVARFFAALGDA